MGSLSGTACLGLAAADLAGPESGGACLLGGGKDHGTVPAGVITARAVVVDAAFGVAVQFARSHDGAGHAQHQQQGGQEAVAFFHLCFSWTLTWAVRQRKTAGRIVFLLFSLRHVREKTRGDNARGDVQ